MIPFKIASVPALILAAGLLLAGCGAKDDDSTDTASSYPTEVTVNNLVGSWVETITDGTSTMTLNSDMTYDKVIELGGDFPMTTTSHDTWSLSGDHISINYSDFGTVSEYTVTLEGSIMVWDNGTGQIIYRRKS